MNLLKMLVAVRLVSTSWVNEHVGGNFHKHLLAIQGFFQLDCILKKHNRQFCSAIFYCYVIVGS